MMVCVFGKKGEHDLVDMGISEPIPWRIQWICQVELQVDTQFVIFKKVLEW